MRAFRSTDFALASIIEFSNDAIISVGLDGLITSWNRTAEHLFGYTAEEIVGQAKNVPWIFPPDRLGEERDMIARLRRGEVVAQYETKRLRKDGTQVLVSLTASPNTPMLMGKIVGASKDYSRHHRTKTLRRTRSRHCKGRNGASVALEHDGDDGLVTGP